MIPRFHYFEVQHSHEIGIGLCSPASHDEANNIEIFKRTSPSVVNITNARRVRSFYSLNPQDVPQGSGTGFVWDTQGHIVTNFHVVQQADRVLVTLQDGMTFDAVPVGVAPNHDLAVLKIEADNMELIPIIPGDSSLLEVGRKVVMERLRVII